MTQLLEVEEDQ